MLDNIKTFFLTAVPSSPAFVFAFESPSKTSVIVTIVLPIIFFAVGKTVDVCLQIYFRRQEAGRRERAAATELPKSQKQIASTNSNLERKNNNNEKF